jgi:hypothetical protein
VSSSNLLKGFGVGADVIGQLAVDKAIRRKSTSGVLTKSLDELRTAVAELEGDIITVELTTSPTQTFSHALGRMPNGAIVIMCDEGNAVKSSISAVSPADVTLRTDASNDAVFTIWVI